MSDLAPRPDGANELLHELRLRGWIERSDDEVVQALVARGHAQRREKRVLLTPEGRDGQLHEDLLLALGPDHITEEQRG